MTYLNNRILFISGNATRSGAPLVLKNHLIYLKEIKPNLIFDIFLIKGGELINDFKNIARRTIVNNSGLLLRILYKLTKLPYFKYFTFHRLLRRTQYNIIYGNTILTANYLRIAKEYNKAIITILHVHELQFAIKLYVGNATFITTLSYIDNFVVTSKIVKKMLKEDFQIPESKIFLHYGHIPIKTYLVENNLPVHNSGFKICGSGNLEWHKGIDLFIQIVFLVQKLDCNKDYHFYWIGGNKDSIEYEKAIYDIKKLNIEDKLTIIESCSNPIQFMQACDVFLLSSREDSFPLVCLEAASVQKPIICFEGSGGVVEFVSDDIGWKIEYMDLKEVAKLIIELIGEPTIATQKGKAAYRKVQQYDISLGGEKLYKFISGLTS